MQATRERSGAAAPERLQPPEPYNYRTFKTANFLYDLRATREGHGVQPGDPAPEFCLSTTSGGTLCLEDLRGKPVLLHFGSPT
jgi:hypothetical protein